MIATYKKPDPDCPDCNGRGVVKHVVASTLGKVQEVVSVRCYCTDPKDNHVGN